MSSRDISILGLAASGKADKQIASELGLSLSTVRTYWGRIREKLGASTRAQAVGLYVRGQSSVSGGLPSTSRLATEKALDELPFWRAELDGRPLWANNLGTHWLRKFERDDWRDFSAETRKLLASAVRECATKKRPVTVKVKLRAFAEDVHFVFLPLPACENEAVVILVPPRA